MASWKMTIAHLINRKSLTTKLTSHSQRHSTSQETSRCVGVHFLVLYVAKKQMVRINVANASPMYMFVVLHLFLVPWKDMASLYYAVDAQVHPST